MAIFNQNKMKNNKYHTVGTIPRSNIKIVEKGKIDFSNTQIYRGVSAILSYLNISSFWGITKNYFMTMFYNVVLPKWFYK
jgi:hypothetical protein